MKILVADDHPLVRDALARTVASLDADVRVYEAADFAALRSLAGEHDLDLALVDLNMPGMQGHQRAAHGLRQRFPTHWFLVVASAQDDATTIRNVLATGVLRLHPEDRVARRRCCRRSGWCRAGGVYVPPRVLFEPRRRSVGSPPSTARTAAMPRSRRASSTYSGCLLQRPSRTS